MGWIFLSSIPINERIIDEMTLALSLQFYNLVANLTAKENVELASEIVSDALDPEAVLREVGLGNRLDNFPAIIVRWRATTGGDCSGSGENPKILPLR